jgi:RimJ/RimL family protein N-acetyltransferase/dTDP-4-dehydrorhamnose 3,5-epimerase-like enzyme
MNPPLVQLVDIPQRGDSRGGLSVAELGGALPFPVRRVYWIHGTQPGVSRGFHAHKELRQLCVCVAGSVRFNLFDGRHEESVVLDSPSKGLLIGPGLWREMHDFSAGCVLMVFASAEYDEADYVRSRECFEEWVRANRSGPEVSFSVFDRKTLDLSFDWLSDPELRRLTDSPVIEKTAQLRWFEGLSARSDYKAWTVNHKGEPIGTVGLKRIEGDKAEYFGYIGVKSYWGKGIGTAMLDFAEMQARRLGLDRLELRVIDDNPRARALYIRRGFLAYQTGGGYCLMAKNISR